MYAIRIHYLFATISFFNPIRQILNKEVAQSSFQPVWSSFKQYNQTSGKLNTQLGRFFMQFCLELAVGFKHASYKKSKDDRRRLLEVANSNDDFLMKFYLIKIYKVWARFKKLEPIVHMQMYWRLKGQRHTASFELVGQKTYQEVDQGVVKWMMKLKSL